LFANSPVSTTSTSARSPAQDATAGSLARTLKRSSRRVCHRRPPRLRRRSRRPHRLRSRHQHLQHR
jgi:hypothetical protein